MYKRIVYFDDWEGKLIEYYINSDTNSEFLENMEKILPSNCIYFGGITMFLFDKKFKFNSIKDVKTAVRRYKEFRYFDDTPSTCQKIVGGHINCDGFCIEELLEIKNDEERFFSDEYNEFEGRLHEYLHCNSKVL